MEEIRGPRIVGMVKCKHGFAHRGLMRRHSASDSRAHSEGTRTLQDLQVKDLFSLENAQVYHLIEAIAQTQHERAGDVPDIAAHAGRPLHNFGAQPITTAVSASLDVSPLSKCSKEAKRAALIKPYMPAQRAQRQPFGILKYIQNVEGLPNGIHDVLSRRCSCYLHVLCTAIELYSVNSGPKAC